MTTETKRKPKCIKGTACGFACISSKSNCSDKIKSRATTSLLKAVNIQPKNSNDGLPKPFDKSDPSHEAIYELDVPPDKVQVTFGAGLLSSVTNAVEIDIYVNNTTNARDSAVAPDNSIKVALSAMRSVKKHVATMPDGTLLTNTPAKADGKGEARVKLYEKAGFKLVGDGSNTMYAVVKDGKITPVDFSYVKSNYEYVEDSFML